MIVYVISTLPIIFILKIKESRQNKFIKLIYHGVRIDFILIVKHIYLFSF